MPANANDIRTFAQARQRLEAIVEQVKGNDTPLEKSLDLYEEAIKVGNRCSDLIDNVDFTAEEVALLRSGEAFAAEDVAEGADSTHEQDPDAVGRGGVECVRESSETAGPTVEPERSVADPVETDLETRV